MKRSLIGEKNPGYLAGHSDNWKDERESAVCLFVSWRFTLRSGRMKTGRHLRPGWTQSFKITKHMTSLYIRILLSGNQGRILKFFLKGVG